MSELNQIGRLNVLNLPIFFQKTISKLSSERMDWVLLQMRLVLSATYLAGTILDAGVKVPTIPNLTYLTKAN